MSRVIKTILNKNSQRSQPCFTFIVVFLTGILFSNIQYVGAQQKNLTIAPNEKIQSILNNVASPTEEDEKTFSNDGEKFLKSKFAGLTETEKDVQHILQQVVYFRTNALKMRSNNEISSVQMDQVTGASYLILKEFLTWDEKTGTVSSESAQIIINAVVPYLGTKDYVLRKQLHWLLEKVDYHGNYSEYESYIKNRKANPPLTLIQYMYGSPGGALSTLMNIYTEDPAQKQALTQKKEIVDSELRRLAHAKRTERQVNPEAINALNELSQDSQWWVRLYAAEIVNQESGFAESELISRLENDINPLVKEVINRIKQREEINKRRLEIREITSYLADYTESLISSDEQLHNQFFRVRGLADDYYFSKSRPVEEWEEKLQKVEEKLAELIPLVKEALTDGKISFKEFVITPFKEDYVSESAKKFIIKEYLTDPQIIEKAKKEELDELKGVLENISPEIPEAKEALKIIR